MSERLSIAYADRSDVPARVTFSRRGRGVPLVLIHGVGLQSGVWEPQVEALSARHDVIAMDMLGHGGSSLPPDDARLVDYSAAVLALLDGLGIAQAHIVGHSMGGLVALDFALDHPGRVLSVTAMSAVFCRTVEQSRAVMARAGSADEASGPRDGSVANAAAGYAEWLVAASSGGDLEETGNKGGLRPHVSLADVVSRIHPASSAWHI